VGVGVGVGVQNRKFCSGNPQPQPFTISIEVHLHNTMASNGGSYRSSTICPRTGKFSSSGSAL
ncbi:MAG: hypothetical protein ACRD32_03575, partial [Nitrososphaerales archaeon]